MVTCYNYGRFLADCLNSIAVQKGFDFEVVLVDDGSTDNTQEVARHFSGLPLRVITHRNNLGIVATFNEGLQEAKGAYVARIDADDRYRPYFLAETLGIFKRFPSVDLVYGDIAAMNAGGEIISDPWPGIRSREANGGKDFRGCEYLPLIEDDFIPAATIIARREVWMQALPIPEWFTFSTVSDWYLNLRMARSHEFYYIARALADYRLHSENLHRKAKDGESLEKTVLRVLSQFFSEEDPWMKEKLRMRRRVYASAYRNFINAYSGMRRGGDCWRCFFEMLSYRPDYAFQAKPLKRLLATLLGWDRYERLAHSYRSILGRR